MTRDDILNALERWVKQRPGLDSRNYGDSRTAYFADKRKILRHLSDARIMLTAVRRTESIGVPELRESFRAYSGRLSLRDVGAATTLDYCTGQYWPTEYRAAACAVLASALWSDKRVRMGGGDPFNNSHEGLNPGDWLRREFRREFGPNMQKRWFD